VRELELSLAAHRVLVFRGRSIDDAAHARFARSFGPVGTFGSAGTPEIYRSANVDEHGRLLPVGHERTRRVMLNWLWHSDSSYRTVPNRAGLLRAIEVPNDGGETEFADMVAAYDALPAAMRARIAGLRVRHSFDFLVRSQGEPGLDNEAMKRLPAIEHLLVREHADGRGSLYLSPPYMERVVGLEPAAGRALLEELLAWSTQERFVYRHHWQAHDLLMWDNHRTMHRVTPYDIEHLPRVMHGTTIEGAAVRTLSAGSAA
jgi:alpha-ketoglutarate-dependent taurine dioxygenase